MRSLRQKPGKSLLRLTAFVALGIAIVAIGLVVMSFNGKWVSGFETDELPGLVGDEQIRSWVSLDEESYLIGDLVRYRIRLLWRADLVLPDLRSFETSINFYPLDHVSHQTQERQYSEHVREYVAEFLLQAINIDVPTSVLLDTVSVYYTAVDDATRTVHPFRENAPPAQFGEYYPADVSGIELLPPKPAIDIGASVRRSLMMVCASAMFLLGAGLLWIYGKRRADAELSAAERLWRQIDQRGCDHDDGEAAELRCEKLMTQALQLRTGINPAQFWTCAIAAGDEWHDEISNARRLLGEIYRPSGMSSASLGHIKELTRSLLQPMVDDARLIREAMDDPWQRLRQTPTVLAIAGGAFIVALFALILAAFPAAWVPGEINRYNETSALLAATGDVEQAGNEFARIADVAKDARVESASLYNLGTLMASPLRSRLSPEQHRNFLQAIFQPTITLTRFLHDVELDTEAELLTMLSEITRQYVQAEQALRAAARAGPVDASINRNLELLGKVRRAIGQSLQQLITEGESQKGSEQILGQTIIDLKVLMETELPEEFSKTDAGKDDRGYFIMERF